MQTPSAASSSSTAAPPAPAASIPTAASSCAAATPPAATATSSAPPDAPPSSQKDTPSSAASDAAPPTPTAMPSGDAPPSASSTASPQKSPKIEVPAYAAAPPTAAVSPHSDASTSATSVKATTTGKKRKYRRPAVTDDEDIAILRAAAEVDPHSAMWGDVKRRWQRVAQMATADVGGDVETMSHMFCQRRYEMLVDKFILKRELNKEVWPASATLHALLDAAAARRKEREQLVEQVAEQNRTRARQGQPPLTLVELRTILARMADAQNASAASVKKEPNHESDDGDAAIKVDDSNDEEDEAPTVQFVAAPDGTIWRKEECSKGGEERTRTGQPPATTPARPPRSHEMKRVIRDRQATRTDPRPRDVDADWSNVPAARHSFLESSLTTVLDQLVTMQSSWMESAKEDRELQKRRLEVELKTAAAVTSGNSEIPQSAHACPVTAKAFAELKREVAVLTSSLTTSRNEHSLLTVEVRSLSVALSDSTLQNDALKRDVAELQLLLQDAASLAGTLKLLRDSHTQHEQAFDTYVEEHDARIQALEHKITRTNAPSSVDPAVAAVPQMPNELLATIRKQHDAAQALHREKLLQLDTKMALLDGSIAVVNETLAKQNAQSQSGIDNTDSRTELAVAELRAAVEEERAQRLSDYGTLLKTIEDVVAGRANLI